MTEQRVIWQPQPGPQEALIACPIFEILFGGARGGGKTDGVLGEWAAHADQYKADAIGLMLRRSRVELGETIERSRALYTPLGAKWHDRDSMWRMPNGARLRMAYLERDADAEGYQGHSYTRLYPEELGNFPREGPVRKLLATLRSAQGVPVGMRATANPGGPGHSWVRQRYIDPAPAGWRVITDAGTGLQRIYIPSRIKDNRYLGEDYVRQLRMVGSEALVRAWLEGDWTAVEGAYFPEFSMTRHVIAPFEVPKHWLRFRAMDWGSAAPFCVGWWAVASDDFRIGERTLPRGCMVGYREWYGKGEKLTAEELGQGIVDRERADRDDRRKSLISYGVLDPSAFANDGGPSIAERLVKAGAGFRPADNKRIARHGALGGWDQVRARLKGDELGRPMIVWFHTCADSIRTIPLLQHDKDKPEDLDTESEDHAADEVRYACMSRPYAKDAPAQRHNRTLAVGADNNLSLDDLWETVPRRSERV